mgnify:CR=1 FL=1
MENVLPTETNQHQNTTTHLIQQIQKNTTTQVEAHRVNHLITDIISQFKLLMEYLPAEDYLEETLENLLMIRKLVREENRSLLFEFELLKGELIDSQNPCKYGGGGV